MPLWRTRSSMQPRFADRVEAGQLLAERLERYQGATTLVLGIPRGGVPVAAAVARRLGAELDVVVARKLGAPNAPELAIGATTANGGLVLDDATIAALGVSGGYLHEVILAERAEAQRREAQFRGNRPPATIAGRIVLVIDDGLATGATMRAAVRSVRQGGPARLIVAVPVGSREACAMMATEADKVVCLSQPQPFVAVGLHYDRFESTENAEVERLLAEAAERHRELAPQQLGEGQAVR